MTEKKSSKLHGFINPKVIESKRLYWRTWVVTRLRILFPVIAGIILLFIFVWPSIKSRFSAAQKIVGQEVSQGDLENNSASQMSFSTTDKHGNPIEIFAEKGIELDLQQVLLTRPKLLIKHQKIGPISMNGLEGAYKPASKELILKGDVVIHHDEGHNLTTSGMTFDLEHGIGKTTGHASVTSPLGCIEAKEIEISTIDKTITLRGRPVITFFGEAMQK